MKKSLLYIGLAVMVGFFFTACTHNNPNHDKFGAEPEKGELFFNTTTAPSIHANSKEISIPVAISALVNAQDLAVSYSVNNVEGVNISNFIKNTTGTLVIKRGELSTVLVLELDTDALAAMQVNQESSVFNVVLNAPNRESITLDQDNSSLTLTYQPPCVAHVGTTYHAQTSAPSIGAPASAFEPREITLTEIGDNTYSVTDLWGPDVVSVIAGNSSYYGQFPYPATITLDPGSLEVTITPSAGNQAAGSTSTGYYDSCSDVFVLTLEQAVFTDPFTVQVELTGL